MDKSGRTIRVSIISPIKNESQFVGYSIMAVLPYVHEIVYACAKSTDGTDELLDYIKSKYAKDKLILLRDDKYDFDPHDMEAYNASFNDCIERTTGDAVWFCHPDMIPLNPEHLSSLPQDALAWWTNLQSYARDFSTKITSGRTGRWKNIHKKELGLHYYGGYGSVNEDFYHSDITGQEHVFHGDMFDKYPFSVKDSGLDVNHYCELKPYERRLEKMKKCLKTQVPGMSDSKIHELAKVHPRVTLDATTSQFGDFKFERTENIAPKIFKKHEKEFSSVLGKL